MRREDNKVIIGTITSVIASFLMNLGTLEKTTEFYWLFNLIIDGDLLSSATRWL